ncbi:MAG: 3-methyl-2-oxobutanoate hydroxymethyltransferase [Gemmatimonadaceae bacterium]
MSAISIADRITELSTRSRSDKPLVMLTAYDAVSASIVDSAGVDLILVGDSAATTLLGYATTREVSVGEMLMLTRAARRGVKHALLVGDLPFGSYEGGDDVAVHTAQLFMSAGCDFVKLEGAGERLSRVVAILGAGIPVIGHVGLLPQSATKVSDLRARARQADDAIHIVNDAIALAKAGCSAVVIEAVPAIVASAIAERIDVPVIGIGAGAGVGGQVLVMHDLLGLTDGHLPRFVRTYAQSRESWIEAVQRYAVDVRARTFPSSNEEYSMPTAEQARFIAFLEGSRPLGSPEGAG